MTSGGRPRIDSSLQSRPEGHSIGGGASAGSPMGAPASTHATIVPISSSVSETSFLNSWIPTFRSTCQGGISRVDTFSRMTGAHGRTSS